MRVMNKAVLTSMGKMFGSLDAKVAQGTFCVQATGNAHLDTLKDDLSAYQMSMCVADYFALNVTPYGLPEMRCGTEGRPLVHHFT